MASMVPCGSSMDSLKKGQDVFKIPAMISKCGCGTKKVIPKDGNSYEELVLDTAFTQGVELTAFTTIKLSQLVADFKVLNIILDHAMFREKKKDKAEEERGFVVDTNKVVPDPKFFPLVEGFCVSFLRLHPPCEYHTFDHYLQILEDNRFKHFFDEMVTQLDLTALNVLPDSSCRKKSRKTFSDEYLSDSFDFVHHMERMLEKLTTKYCELEPATRLSYLFTAFSILVEILEEDFGVWVQRLSTRFTVSKFYRPLIVHLLWKDVERFDEDAIVNKFVMKIFGFFSDCLHNKVSAKHLKVVARFINLISEVVDIIGRHQEANPSEEYRLAADFKTLLCLPKLENRSMGFALKQIENGRRKLSKPILYHMDETTVIGSICRNFANKISMALNRCTCKDERECLVLEKAFLFIKPPWLLYLITSNLLKQDSGITSLKTTATEALSDDGALLSQDVKTRRVEVCLGKQGNLFNWEEGTNSTIDSNIEIKRWKKRRHISSRFEESRPSKRHGSSSSESGSSDSDVTRSFLDNPERFKNWTETVALSEDFGEKSPADCVPPQKSSLKRQDLPPPEVSASVAVSIRQQTDVVTVFEHLVLNKFPDILANASNEGLV